VDLICAFRRVGGLIVDFLWFDLLCVDIVCYILYHMAIFFACCRHWFFLIWFSMLNFVLSYFSVFLVDFLDYLSSDVYFRSLIAQYYPEQVVSKQFLPNKWHQSLI